MTTKTDVESGRESANKQSVIGWGIFGWFLPIFAVPVVYLRSPKMATELAAAQDATVDLSLFERAYLEHLKGRQAKAVWVGVICSVVMVALLSSIVESGQSTLNEAIQGVVETQRLVTAAEYAQVAEGMTYAQVQAVIWA